MRALAKSLPYIMAELTADGAGITTANTAILVTPTGLLVAGAFAIGMRFEFRARVNISAAFAPTIKVHMGNAGTVSDGLLFSVTSTGTAGEHVVEGSFVIRTLGATGTVRAEGFVHTGATPGGAGVDAQAEATINTNVENRITLAGSVLTTATLTPRDAYIKQVG